MRTAGKVLAWFIGIIIALYIILALVLHFVVKPDTYKNLVEKAVLQTTGHKMVINGTLDWNMFPTPRLKITDVIIDNKKGTTHLSPYFAKIKEADVQVRLMPLLSGEVVPKTLILRDAHINLVYQSAKNNPLAATQQKIMQKQADMANNPMHQMETGKPSLKLDSDHESHATYLQHMQLPNVTIVNTSINWIDLKDNNITNFKNINLTIHPDGNDTFIKGGLVIAHQQHTITLMLSTNLTRNTDNTVFTFANLAFSGEATTQKTTNSLHYDGPITVDLSKQTLMMKNYKLNWNNLPMNGTVRGQWSTKDSGLSATFTASTHVAGGLINEKGTYQHPDKGADSLRYLISIHKIALAPVLKSLHYDHLLKGTGNLTATLNANNQNKNWVSNLNGNGHFKLTDTELAGLNSAKFFNMALAKARGNPVQDDGITVFSVIAGSFTIHNGVFYNTDLKANARKITSTGTGTINFNDKTINYHLYMKHVNNKDMTLPLIIKGDLQHPKIKLDVKNIIQNTVKNHLFKDLFHGNKHFDLKKLF